MYLSPSRIQLFQRRSIFNVALCGRWVKRWRIGVKGWGKPLRATSCIRYSFKTIYVYWSSSRNDSLSIYSSTWSRLCINNERQCTFAIVELLQLQLRVVKMHVILKLHVLWMHFRCQCWMWIYVYSSTFQNNKKYDNFNAILTAHITSWRCSAVYYYIEARLQMTKVYHLPNRYNTHVYCSTAVFFNCFNCIISTMKIITSYSCNRSNSYS